MRENFLRGVLAVAASSLLSAIIVASALSFKYEWGHRWVGHRVAVDLSEVGLTAWQSVIRGAMSDWNATGADFEFYDATSNNKIKVYVDESSRALAFTYCPLLVPFNGPITKCTTSINNNSDNRFNPPFGGDETGWYDLATVIRHELGHWLELGDLYSENDSNALMYFRLLTNRVENVTQDEINGIRHIYGTRQAVLPSRLDFTVRLGSVPPAQHSSEVSVVVQQRGSSTPTLGPTKVTTDSSGSYNLGLELAGVPQGTYDVCVKPKYYLGLCKRDVHLRVSETAYIDFSQGGSNPAWPGDVISFGDNVVNSIDSAVFISEFRRCPPFSDCNNNHKFDFNRDGVLNTNDYSLLLYTWAHNPWGEGSFLGSGSTVQNIQQSPAQTSSYLSIGVQGTTSYFQVGDEFNLSVWMDANTDTHGADLILHYDPLVLEIQDADSGTPGIQVTVKSGVYSNVAENRVDQSTGLIHISAYCRDCTFRGSAEWVVVRVKAIASPDTSLTTVEGIFSVNETTDSNIAEDGTAFDVLGDVSKEIITISGTPSRPMTPVTVKPGGIESDEFITESSVHIQAVVEDPYDLIQEVFFRVFYDGRWHDIQGDTDGSDGWSTGWDASSVADQAGIEFKAIVLSLGRLSTLGTGESGSFTLDRTSPSLTSVSFTPPSPSSASTVSVQISANDTHASPVAGEMYVNTATDGSDSGEWVLVGSLEDTSAGSIQWNTHGWNVGDHLMSIMLCDRADNCSMEQRTYTLKPPGSPSFRLSPASGSYNVGDEFEVNVILNSGEYQICCYEAYLEFDTTRLEVVSISGGQVNEGRISISDVGFECYLAREMVVATIRFAAIAGGNADVTFDFTPGATNDSNVAACDVPDDVLEEVTDGSFTLIGSSPDSIPPIGRVTSPADGFATSTCPITIQAEASDDQSGVDRVEFWVWHDTWWYHIGDVSTAPYSIDWDCSAIEEQEVGLFIRIWDNAGNKADTLNENEIVWITLDRTDPYGKVIEPIDCSQINGDSITIDVEATDNLSGVLAVEFHIFYNGRWHYLTTDWEGSDGWTATWDMQGLDDQTVIVWAFIWDRAWNLGLAFNGSVHISQSGCPLVDDLSGNHTIDIGEVQRFASWWHTDVWCGYDFDGDGTIRVSEIMELSELLGSSCTALPADSWVGRYYANNDLANNPVLIRNDPEVNFTWDLDSPDPALPIDDFSVEWARKLDFPAGTYCFDVFVDDGVRLRIDGFLVIDEWHEAVTFYSACRELTAGTHVIIVEYFERGGSAAVSLSWSPQTQEAEVGSTLSEHYRVPARRALPTPVPRAVP